MERENFAYRFFVASGVISSLRRYPREDWDLGSFLTKLAHKKQGAKKTFVSDLGY